MQFGKIDLNGAVLQGSRIHTQSASRGRLCLGTSFSICEKIVLQWAMAWFSLLVQQVISKLIVPKYGEIGPLYLPVNGTAVISIGKVGRKNSRSFFN